jgi:hypothetical protein
MSTIAYRRGANSYRTKLITASIPRILFRLTYPIFATFYHHSSFRILSAFRYPYSYQNEDSYSGGCKK